MRMEERSHLGRRLPLRAALLGSSRRTRTGWRLLAVVAVLAFVATGCSKSSSTELTTIFVQKFRFHGMPTSLKSGLHQFYFQNKESLPIAHEMIPVALPSGKKAQDIIDDTKAKGVNADGEAVAEDDWLHIGGDFGTADTGAGVVETLYLPPGNYAIACWQTGNLGGGEGEPHAARGMVFQFTVTS
jgi:hypothetical protein